MGTFFIFLWHLSLAAGFILILYLVATYSALRHELAEIQQLDAKIKSVLAAADPEAEKYLSYLQAQYNRKIAAYADRKNSAYSWPVLRIFKQLDQSFVSY